MQNAIAYYRVSTKRQERSGLGLEAQQHAVRAFAAANGFTLLEEITEQAPGMRSGHPGLTYAQALCREQDAVLLVARLDRLRRRTSYIARLLESGVRVIAVDDPNADEFTMHIKAAMGQKEGRDISARTTAALAAAKRRGTELGTYGRDVQSKRNRKRADTFARKLRPLINALRKSGVTTIRALTAALNRLHIPTYYQDGHRWHRNTVHRLLKRLAGLS